jgi:hypothetical protein
MERERERERERKRERVRARVCVRARAAGREGTRQRSGYGTMLQVGRSRVRNPMRRIHFFSIYLIFPAVLDPAWRLLGPNRNKYNVSGE